MKDTELEIRVTEIMRDMGIPASVLGYEYLRTAIVMAVKNKNLLSCITKGLYPKVAAVHGTTPSRCERAIRHAIEVAWGRGDTALQFEYFGYSVSSVKGKPTNSEFIATITDSVLLEIKRREEV